MSQDAAPVRWEATLPDGRQASLLARPSAINLLLDGEQPSFTFDPLGRLHGAFYEGRNYRRSLDNRVLAKWTTADGGLRQRQRRWLDAVEAQALVDVAYGLARQTAQTTADAPLAVQAALGSLIRWDWTSLEADRARFQQIYTPVGPIPGAGVTGHPRLLAQRLHLLHLLPGHPLPHQDPRPISPARDRRARLLRPGHCHAPLHLPGRRQRAGRADAPAA